MEPATLDPARLSAQELADAIPEALAVIDSTGVIRLVNAAWIDFCRSNGGTLAGVTPPANYLAVCQATDLPAVRDVRMGIAAVLTGRSTRFDAEYPCHSPEQQRWFRLTVAPLPGGAVVTHTDITGEYERVTRWMKNTPIAMIELGLAGEATYVNRWWVDLAGRPRSDVLGPGWTAPVVADERPRLRDAIEEAQRTGTAREIDTRVMQRGAERVLRFAVTPHVDAYGTVRSVGLAGVDITLERELLRQRAASEERRRIGAEVHDTVIQRLFAAAMVIDGAAATGAALSAEEVEFLRRNLESSMTQLRSLTADRPRPRPTDLMAAVDEVVDRGAHALGFPPDVRIEGPLPDPESDVAAELLAVLSEGLANVARHARARTCTVRLEVGASTLTLSIADDGVGMPAQQTRRSGTANIAERAQRLGGSASWQATEGGGTLLTWTVPTGAVSTRP